MVYLIQESLACVFAVTVFAILAFMICGAVLLAVEALKHAYRALQEACGMVSRVVVGRRGDSLEVGRNRQLPVKRLPLAANMRQKVLSTLRNSEKRAPWLNAMARWAACPSTRIYPRYNARKSNGPA
jgi:hypothetical protein